MFYYFGFGSNISMVSLKAKGVEPITSIPATLYGWRLRFNVQHFFRNEGGVGNIEYTGNKSDKVLGILHECSNQSLDALDAAEALGYGYNRITVSVEPTEQSAASTSIEALTYVGIPEFIDNNCLPSQRYLNIIVNGAIKAGLNTHYIERLKAHPVLTPKDYTLFQPPKGEYPCFDAKSLTSYPLYTALYGHVFDMSDARPHHEFLKSFFGGKDMTLFHLKRLDSSDNSETLDDVKYKRLSAEQLKYLNTFLSEYNVEYQFVGYFNYNHE